MSTNPINFRRKAKRVWEWIFPTVLVAMAPLVTQYIWVLLDTQNFYHIYDVLAHRGQILIVGVALLGESMTELVSRRIPTWQKQGIQAICIVYILGASIIYANLAEDVRCMGVSTDNDGLIRQCAGMADMSMGIFFVGIILCLTCKLIGRS